MKNVLLLIFACCFVVNAQDRARWMDAGAVYRSSQLFNLSAGLWDAGMTAHGVPSGGERGWAHAVTGNSTAGAVGLNLAATGLTLLAARELDRRGHRRWATALNYVKGAASLGGAVSWLGGGCHGSWQAVPSATRATYVCRE